MICFWMFNSTTIVLNDYETASALLDRRSSIYSSRPTSWMGGILTGRDHSMFQIKSTNPRFRIYRTLLQKTLHPRALEAHKALQVTECQILLNALKKHLINSYRISEGTSQSVQLTDSPIKLKNDDQEFRCNYHECRIWVSGH